MASSRESRFKVANLRRLGVVFERPDGCAPAVVTGELLDLSRSGGKLKVAQPLKSGEAVLVRIEDAKLDLRLSVSATVCWIRGAGDQWQVGCSFTPNLPESAIGEFLAKGVLERRGGPRQEIRVPMQARWECSASATPRDVDLIDISPGGFCLRSAMPAAVGSRMILLVQGADQRSMEIGAKVRWQVDEPNGYSIGCELNGVTSAAKLHEIVFGKDAPGRRTLACQSWLDRIRSDLSELRHSPLNVLERWLGLAEPAMCRPIQSETDAPVEAVAGRK